MTEEIAVENRRIANVQGLVTLTLDRVILHTIVHHSSTSTYMQNFTEIKKISLCGRTFETGFIRSTQNSRPNKAGVKSLETSMLPLPSHNSRSQP